MSDLVIGKRKALKLNSSLWLNGSLRIEIEPYLCWDTIDKAQAIALIKHLEEVFDLMPSMAKVVTQLSNTTEADLEYAKNMDKPKFCPKCPSAEIKTHYLSGLKYCSECLDLV